MNSDVHLEMDPQAQLVQMPLRRLPIATRAQVKTELEQLVADQVLAPVDEPTRWVSALLVTTKSNGNLRICMDPHAHGTLP
jgi:hypothetical protein